jgi:hypothetical protein
MPEHKFKIGQRVRIINLRGGGEDHSLIGETFIIKAIDLANRVVLPSRDATRVYYHHLFFSEIEPCGRCMFGDDDEIQ